MKKEVLTLNEDEIESISFLGERETIDICVEDTRMFFANDIYTHNSGFNVEYADEQNIGKAIEVYQTCDWMLLFTQSIPMYERGECYCQLLKNRLGSKGITLLVSYDPNKGLFTEIKEIPRTELMNKKQIKDVRQGINLMDRTIKRSLEEKENK